VNDNASTVRVHVAMTDEEVTRIDDWSYVAEIRSRSEAIRYLIRIGMEIWYAEVKKRMPGDRTFFNVLKTMQAIEDGNAEAAREFSAKAHEAMAAEKPKRSSATEDGWRGDIAKMVAKIANAKPQGARS
jgi:hypothetical protein